MTVDLYPWLPRGTESAPAAGRLRLLCFPFAGGGASAYREWAAVLRPAGIDVWPVQLPGRESRLAEQPVVDLGELVNTLAELFGPHLTTPYALFGHSMGATIAYALAQRLQRDDLPAPQRLFLSGHRPPNRPDPEPPVYLLPPDALLARLLDYGGLPAEVLAEREMLDVLLPKIRMDFALFERAAWDLRRPVRCPLTVFGGLDDASVPISVLDGWEELTTGGFSRQLLPGGHFFLQTARPQLLRLIASSLIPAARP